MLCWYFRLCRYARRIVCTFLFVFTNTLATRLDVIPSLPAVITDVNLADYDLYGTGLGPVMFSISLSDIDGQADSNLILKYQLLYWNSIDGEIVLYEGTSNNFIISAGQTWLGTSNQFLYANNPSSMISIHTTERRVDKSILESKILNNQTVPDGRVTFNFTLIQNGNSTGQTASFSTVVLNSTRVELVSPGADITIVAPVIYDMHPVFVWTSDLPAGIYGDKKVFEVRIYKALSGEPPGEAMSRPPVVKGQSTSTYFKFPDNGPQLIPGATYYWEVVGFLQSTTPSQVRSGVFRFRVNKSRNPYVDEVMGLLKLIYGPEVLQKVYEFDSEVSVRINGKLADTEQLRRIVQKIQSGELTLRSTSVY